MKCIKFNVIFSCELIWYSTPHMSKKIATFYCLPIAESEPGKSSSKDGYLADGRSNAASGLANIEFSLLNGMAVAIEVYWLVG